MVHRVPVDRVATASRIADDMGLRGPRWWREMVVERSIKELTRKGLVETVDGQMFLLVDDEFVNN